MAIVSLMELGATNKLSTISEGEYLMNDQTTIVSYSFKQCLVTLSVQHKQ
jgi:hypothetical protein